MIANLIGPLSQAAVTWIAALVGTKAVAALGVATRIEGLATMIFYAMGAGVSIFSGQNFGAGNYGRIRDMIELADRYVFIWSVVSGAFMILLARQIPLLFDKDPAVIAYTAQYLRIVPVSYAPLGIMIIVNSAMNAMGKPFTATALILLRAFILYVPLAYIGERELGFPGIPLAMMMTNFIVGITSHLWNKVTAP